MCPTSCSICPYVLRRANNRQRYLQLFLRLPSTRRADERLLLTRHITFPLAVRRTGLLRPAQGTPGRLKDAGEAGDDGARMSEDYSAVLRRLGAAWCIRGANGDGRRTSWRQTVSEQMSVMGRRSTDARKERYQKRQTSPLKAGNWWMAGSVDGSPLPGGRQHVDGEMDVIFSGWPWNLPLEKTLNKNWTSSPHLLYRHSR